MRVMGKQLLIHVPKRKSTDAPVPNAVLSFGDKHMVLDDRNMPGQLLRLLPSGYLCPNMKGSDFVPFVQCALSLGLLK